MKDVLPKPNETTKEFIQRRINNGEYYIEKKYDLFEDLADILKPGK